MTTATDLHQAACRGDFAEVERLIGSGIDVNASTRGGTTPLMVAAKNGYVRIIQLLAAAGADPGRGDVDGDTALLIAINHGRQDAAVALLSAGADPDQAASRGGTPLIVTAIRGDVQLTQSVLKADANPNKSTPDGWTALMFAAKEGHLKIAELLIAAGADVNAMSNDGMTPLMNAANSGHVDIARSLLDHDASVDIADQRRKTALTIASLRGHVSTIELILERGADIEGPHEAGSPLIWAAYQGEPDAVKTLLSRGANVDRADEDGRTALICACARQLSSDSDKATQTVLIKSLLEHGADVNARDSSGRTALLYAAATGVVDIVALLLDAGADTEAGDDDGTALIRAAFEAHPEVLRVLLSHGASLEARNADGATALICAVARSHPVQRKNDQARVVQLLLESHARTDIVDGRGMTALEWASRIAGNSELVSILTGSSKAAGTAPREPDPSQPDQRTNRSNVGVVCLFVLGGMLGGVIGMTAQDTTRALFAVIFCGIVGLPSSVFMIIAMAARQFAWRSMGDLSHRPTAPIKLSSLAWRLYSPVQSAFPLLALLGPLWVLFAVVLLMICLMVAYGLLGTKPKGRLLDFAPLGLAVVAQITGFVSARFADSNRPARAIAVPLQFLCVALGSYLLFRVFGWAKGW